MIPVVLDTNILVSSLLATGGNEAAVIEQVKKGLLQPCCTADLFAEYRLVLGRSRFQGFQGHAADLLALLERTGLNVEPAASPFRSPDASDTKFIACALAADARYLVIGNRRHFPAGSYGGTLVVNASELLARLIIAP